MSKYNAVKTTIDGQTFASKAEAKRYLELKGFERQGLISGLHTQVRFELVPKQDGERAVSYVADFVYTQDDKLVVEDVKGMRTPVYKLKKKLMLYRHGIRVLET